MSPTAERRAQQWVPVSFFLLAPYVAAEAVETLIEGAAAETSWLGIALTTGTLVFVRGSGVPNSASAKRSGRVLLTAKGRKTSCAPSSRARCWSGWLLTLYSACGGLIP